MAPMVRSQQPGDQWSILVRADMKRHSCCQVMLSVTYFERSIKFYTEALGMKLLRTRDNPENKYKLAFLGSAPSPRCVVASYVDAAKSHPISLNCAAASYVDATRSQFNCMSDPYLSMELRHTIVG